MYYLLYYIYSFHDSVANQYKVTVYTGDKRGAGTDANVYITLFGDAGESTEMRLDTKGKNDFERRGYL